MTITGISSQTAASATKTNLLRRKGMYAAATALIGGLATLLDSKAAHADPLGSPCCELATGRWCPYTTGRDRWYCTTGNRTYWTCRTSSGRTVFCGECADGGDCYSGPFYCSIWYY
ncbi:hypothetical protein [Nonomuraea typhae]|uniref:Twin-arginine translocation signal domain-containing protein n=1 Tax=Nonomuraea typhae TaxID=2603600 RepID=A0ABW7YLC3_9ACTN